MKLVTIFVAMIFALSASAYAQGRGNGQAKKTTVSGPKATSPAKPVKTAKAETRVAKTETRAAKTTAKAVTRASKAETKAARKSGTIPTTTTTVVTPTTPTTHSVKNPKLEARLLTLLPAGTNIQDASQGFKNWGQFVAAAHVSSNLGIPFADLKAKMTGLMPGTTPGTTVPTTTPMSLGQAIQSLKGTTTTVPGTTTEPGTLSSTKIRTEVKKAEDAANLDLRRSL
jgi:hypothetical protein